MSLNLESLETREMLYSTVAISVGGIVQLRDEAGYILNTFRPFEYEASKVPLSLALTENTIQIGSGIGGGPRYQIRDRFSLTIIKDEFIGDESSRTGVSLSSFNEQSEKSKTIDSIVSINKNSPQLVSILELEHIKTILFKVPINALLAGGTISVFKGGSITSLPEFSNLKGLLTSVVNDGDRTYDQVYEAASGSIAYINPDNLSSGSLNTVIHEWSHTYGSKFSFFNNQSTIQAFNNRGSWALGQDSYYYNIQEWFAEGMTRHIVGDYSLLTEQEHNFFSGALNE